MQKNMALICKIDGLKIKEGMDVHELGNMLNAFGSLLQESNRIVNPSARDLVVLARPFKKGSILIELAVRGEEIIQKLMDYASTEGQQIKELLSFLGMVSGLDINLLNLIKMIRGKPISVKKTSKGEYEYSTGTNSITVPGEVHTLYQNSSIQNNIQNIYVSPFEGDRVEVIETHLKGKRGKVKIVKSDVDAFRNYCSNVPTEIESKQEETNESIEYLRPTRGSFKGDKSAKAYSFNSNKKGLITGNILDENFLNKLKTGEVRFHYSDLLKVRIREEHKQSHEGIASVYHILKVIEYKRRDEQLSFPEPS
jgi:hypothetical protein